MSKETNLYDWMRERIKKMVLREKPDFTGYLCLWDDYYRGNFNLNNYSVYQMEDLHRKEIFTPEYKRFLDNAKYVFDYSKNNLLIYPRAISLPLVINRAKSINNNKNIAILFYGVLSTRRLRMINNLKNNNIFIRFIEGVYGNNLTKLLKDYKYVLSIGKVDNKYL